MAQGKIINASGSGNCVLDNKVFILDDFSSKTSNELIKNLSDLVFSLPQGTLYQADTKIFSPYNITNDYQPIIDVFINSSGGDGKILDSIVALLGIAKSRGAIIRTTVLGHASSCGSLLAITGTKGYRIMYSQSYHLVHFGTHSARIEKKAEIELAAQHIQRSTANKTNMYLQHTNLTTKDLKKLQSHEYGFLSAQECLDKGLCDWIINDFGNIIGHGQR